MKATARSLLVAAAFALASPLSHYAAPALAGHPGLKGHSLDAEGVKAVLLGKRVTIGDTRVVLVIAKSSDVQETFLKSSVAMTTAQFQNHWRRLFMTGGGSAPKIVESEADAAKLAAETPGAVVIGDSATLGDLALLSAP
jgi:hypothetical protein